MLAVLGSSPRAPTIMASFKNFIEQAPELAERSQQLLLGHVHHVLGTLRADGYPRLSGTEIRISGGELYWGAMPDSRKAHDLRRDSRFCLHSGTADPPHWKSDVKITGRAIEVDQKERARVYPELEGQDFSLFRADIEEVALVRVEEDQLTIDLFHHLRGQSQIHPKS